MTLTRTGFPWADRPLRFVAYTLHTFAYGETPEAALAGLLSLGTTYGEDS